MKKMKERLMDRKQAERGRKEVLLPPATVREELWDLFQRRMG